MKKLLALLVLALALTGCSAGYDSFSSSSMTTVAESASFDSSSSSSSSSTGGAVTTTKQVQDSKFIYTVNLEAETTTFDDDIATLRELVSSMDGYFEYASQQDRGSYRYGSYTIRIDVNALEAFTAEAGSLLLITSSTSKQEDITYEYYDTQGRLETQQLKLERLQQLLAQAETMEDLITLESAISETQEAIDTYSGSMVQYDSLVDYATINLNVWEVSTLSNVEETPVGFSGQLGSAFTSGIANFVDTLGDLAIFLAYNWLSLAVWALVITLVVRVARGKVRLPKWRKKKIDPPKEDQ